MTHRLLSQCRLAGSIVLLTSMASPAFGEGCLAPQRPYIPSDSRSAREYADLIRSDFELYIRDAQGYFRCLEEERERAFEEAREVSEEYGRFLDAVGD